MSSAVGDKIMKDIRPGAAFEPTYIYRLLTLIKSSLSEKVTNAASGFHVLLIHFKAVIQDFMFLLIDPSSGTDSTRRKCSCCFRLRYLQLTWKAKRKFGLLHAESILIQFKWMKLLKSSEWDVGIFIPNET